MLWVVGHHPSYNQQPPHTTLQLPRTPGETSSTCTTICVEECAAGAPVSRRRPHFGPCHLPLAIRCRLCSVLVASLPASSRRNQSVSGPRRLAVGESSVILTAPPLISLLKHLLKVQGGVPSNDSLADGYRCRLAPPRSGAVNYARVGEIVG